MITLFIIFFISIVLAFGMLFFKAYEIKKNPDKYSPSEGNTIPEVPFRHVEKIVLYLLKNILQSFILIFVKYWFIVTNKIKKWFMDKWPKIHSYFIEKPKSIKSYRHSFVQKAVLESKAKIKVIKDKINEEME